MMQNVAIVIPAYNEETTIRQVTQQALEYGLQVIVVNDGSTDNTAAVTISPIKVKPSACGKVSKKL
jgi:glycosyltransferase involved in cell wall biosynthesis